jgi:L-ascorbate metabolism protein UlaG (beta-lactamase superfamily)
MQPIKTLVLPADDAKTDFENGSIFFVGTATILLRYAGFTILTDPNFLHKGNHVHLGYGIRSTRLTNPALDIEQLPPLDFILLSHMHEDHFDRVAEEKLDRNLPIVSTSHATAKLKKKGFQALHALETWETIAFTKGDARLDITAMPGIHGPSILGALLPPVMGSMLEFQTQDRETKFRIYITGDTLVCDRLKEIPKRYSNIDLALLHLGGTKAFGILLTMDAKEGVKAIQIIEPRTAIPIHYNDYTVFKSSLQEFIDAIAIARLEDKVHYLSHGDTYHFHVSS